VSAPDKEIRSVTRPRTLALTLTALAAAALLAACGSTGSGTPSPAGAGSTFSGMSGMQATSSARSSGFNAQDETFATDMIIHHRQAVQMAALVPGRSTNAKVLALAARIQAAQQPEIDTMTGWLTAWGSAMPEDMARHDMGESMPGMMSAADLADLKATRGAEFDRMFLTMMIAHHEGALTMSRAQVAKGSNPDATTLAQTIIAAQTTEISQMRGLLAG
jgi:uncharacterized protein (DUF305 family)